MLAFCWPPLVKCTATHFNTHSPKVIGATSTRSVHAPVTTRANEWPNRLLMLLLQVARFKCESLVSSTLTDLVCIFKTVSLYPLFHLEHFGAFDSITHQPFSMIRSSGIEFCGTSTSRHPSHYIRIWQADAIVPIRFRSDRRSRTTHELERINSTQLGFVVTITYKGKSPC
jgi:hypothetical protein